MFSIAGAHSPCTGSSVGRARRWMCSRSPCTGSYVGRALRWRCRRMTCTDSPVGRDRRWSRPRSPCTCSCVCCDRRWSRRRSPCTTHWLLTRSCSHMEVPPHVLHWFLCRPCSQMEPPRFVKSKMSAVEWKPPEQQLMRALIFLISMIALRLSARRFHPLRLHHTWTQYTEHAVIANRSDTTFRHDQYVFRRVAKRWCDGYPTVVRQRGLECLR